MQSFHHFLNKAWNGYKAIISSFSKLGLIVSQVHDLETKCFDVIEGNHASLVFQVHIKPDPANQFISAGIVSGVATVSIGQ